MLKHAYTDKEPMPRLFQPQGTETRVEFVASVPLDLLNAMCFTSLAGQLEGLPEPPRRIRERMDPALRDELDLLFAFPAAEWGVLGTLVDVLILHREAWSSVDALLDFVRALPAGGDGTPRNLGIQGLSLAAPCMGERVRAGKLTAAAGRREVSRIAAEADRDVDEALVLFDDPEQVRARLLKLIRRFYDEHYRPDEAFRVECMRRTAEARNSRRIADVDALMRELTGRDISCITEEAARYGEFICVPSIDVGPYSSCADFPPVHGLFYQCEPRFMGVSAAEDDVASLALVYRALADEQRLRILRLLQDGELYAQEIVARTGIHQSVVSRHLSFLKAVDLVKVRRQNNMKFFAVNAQMHERLARALESFLAPKQPPEAVQSANGRRPRRVE
jgi:DNA-binding transcriptional ArsR family regulator